MKEIVDLKGIVDLLFFGFSSAGFWHFLLKGIKLHWEYNPKKVYLDEESNQWLPRGKWESRLDRFDILFCFFLSGLWFWSMLDNLF